MPEEIRQRKLFVGRRARDLGEEITALRKEAKSKWLLVLMNRAFKKDFHATSYLNRRQSVIGQDANRRLSPT